MSTGHDSAKILQAGAQVAADGFAHGELDGGMFVTFRATDRHTAVRGASPMEAAGVIAPAVLRAAATRMRDECSHVTRRVFCMAHADDLDRWAREIEATAAVDEEPS